MTLRRYPALVLLFAALLAVRAVVPTGWMPIADAEGMRIVLCTGQGMVTATIDSEGKLHKDGEDRGPRETCPYGTLAHAATPPALPELAAAPLPAAESPAPLRAIALAALLHAPRPPTRGPPTLA